MTKIYLSEERNRLNLKSKEVAKYAEIALSTQSNYESGKRMPDANYLKKITELGFDVNFVITGKRGAEQLSSEEKILIDLFRKAPDIIQQYIVAGLLINSNN